VWLTDGRSPMSESRVQMKVKFQERAVKSAHADTHR
jgi:hypothetical protein